MERNIAVVLSGCGYLDGAEVTEAVSSLVALSKEGAKYQVFAPDIDLKEVNHQTSEETGQTRNVLLESARISRGNVENISKLNVDKFDALVLPGGFGAAKNLSDFASKGYKASVNESLSKCMKIFFEQSKPIAAFCISPAIVGLVLGNDEIAVTIGSDLSTSKEIEKTGAEHIVCDVTDFVTDREHKIITSPAYMYDAKPHEVFIGIEKAIRELIEMA
ncbi:MAG: isoprenoid biosynthesis glyoxalase ElbB [Bdellovibrionales bacterium]